MNSIVCVRNVTSCPANLSTSLLGAKLAAMRSCSLVTLMLAVLASKRVNSFAPSLAARCVRTGGLNWGEKAAGDDATGSQDDGEAFSFTKKRQTTPKPKQSRRSGPSGGGWRGGDDRRRGVVPRNDFRRGPPRDRRGREDEGNFRGHRSERVFQDDEDDDPNNIRQFRSNRPGPPREDFRGDRRGPPRERRGDQVDRPRFGSNDRARRRQDDPERINLRLLSDAGYEHLYGLSPVLNALMAASSGVGRDLTAPEPSDIDTPPLPAKSAPLPTLFVQPPSSVSTRSASKSASTSTILSLASSLSLPVVELDKGTLNSLSGNRPHQGYVLRCPELDKPDWPGFSSASGPRLIIGEPRARARRRDCRAFAPRRRRRRRNASARAAYPPRLVHLLSSGPFLPVSPRVARGQTPTNPSYPPYPRPSSTSP